MSFKRIAKNYDNSAEFIVGDHFVNVQKMHPRAEASSPGFATLVGDRYIVTAGTVIKANDEVGPPLGLCFRDVDVTDGAQMIAVTVHAVVDRTALKKELNDNEESAMKGIVFINGH